MGMKHKSFRFGEWRVDPATNTLSCGVLNRQLEPRAMDVLLYLCRHPHVVISAETLLDACWGDVSPSDNAIHKIITQLRRALDDSATEPRYIETIRKRGYRLLAELSYDDEVSQGSWLHASPFRGLEAFEEQHAAIFFGRKLSVDQLVQVVVAQAQAACAMVLVLGPSGAGKTSLVQAGLIPALKAGAAPAESGIAISAHVQLDCADMGQSGLLETLASVLLDAEIDGRLLFENTSAAALAQHMAQDLPSLIEHLQRELPAIQLLLFIDRFEAVFRLPHVTDTERAVFINVLDQLARSGSMQLVLACRNDFYPHLASYPALMSLKLSGGHFDLTPPGSADIAQIVRHPAQVAQLRYTVDERGEGLDEVLCHAARSGADSLPLLQYCLQELYRQRSPEGELSHAAFHAMGGLEGAIGARAEQVISELGAPQIAALPHVLSQLVLVAEDEATVSSRRVPWSALRNDAEIKLVQALVDAHLFVSDLQGGAPAFGLAHEALLRRWPRVVAWIEEHRQTLQIRSRISAQANRWQESGRKRDMLLPSGTQTNQAKELLKTTSFRFTTEELNFIDLSLSVAQRAERLRIGIMAMITALALLAAILGLKARNAQIEAEAHRTEAEGLMGFMLGEFVEKLRPLGKLELLDAVSTRALSYLSSPERANDNEADLTQRARSLQVVAEVRNARGDSSGAVIALLNGRTLLKNLISKNPKNTQLLKSAGENAFWLGQIHFDQREWEQAKRYFEDYKFYSYQRAALAPKEVDSWIEQSFAHNSLGSVALRLDDVRHAAAEFAFSVELKSKAYAAKPKDKELALELADSLSWQASTKMQVGELAAADALYNRQLELLQELQRLDPDNTILLKKLADAWSRRSDLKQAQGDISASHENAKQSLQIYSSAVKKDPSNQRTLQFMHIAELRVFNTDTSIIRPDNAFTKLETLQSAFSEHSKLEPKKSALKVHLAGIHQRKAEWAIRSGNLSLAIKEIDLVMEILGKLHSAAPGDKLVTNAWIDALLLRADLRPNSDNGSSSDCEIARDSLQPSINNTADFKVLSRWVQVNACLNQGHISTASKKQLEAMSYRDPAYLNYISTHPLKKAIL